MKPDPSHEEEVMDEQWKDPLAGRYFKVDLRNRTEDDDTFCAGYVVAKMGESHYLVREGGFDTGDGDEVGRESDPWRIVSIERMAQEAWMFYESQREYFAEQEDARLRAEIEAEEERRRASY